MKLTREPLYEQAYEAILRMILEGTLEPGERIKETALARTLGVSPTPVREAMRKLEHDCLLQSNGAGVQVVELRAADIEQLYACREALELVAVAAAVEKLSDETIADLEALLDAAQAAAQQEDFLQLVRINTDFHDHIIAAAQNPWLMSAIGFVRRPLLLARIQIILNQGELQRLLHDHRAIWQALADRDVAAATATMRHHLRADCEYMREKLAQRLSSVPA